MSLLKFSGKGYKAVIAPHAEEDTPINLDVSSLNGEKYMSIQYSDDEQALVLNGPEIIALRDYLNQICTSL